MDHHIRIGADHRHAASEHRPQLGLVVIEGFGLVASKASAQDIVGVSKRDELRSGPVSLHSSLEKGKVALWPDVEDLIARLLFHQSNRDVA